MAVVIVAFNNADTIAATVEAAQALPDSEVVVVVDNGTDGSAEIAKAAGATVIRRSDNPGFGTSQNAGVALTKQPFVLLLNPDADPDPNGIRAGLDELRACPELAAVQGVITSRYHGGPERSMGPDLRWIHLVGRALALRGLLRTRVGRRLAVLAGVADHVERVPPVPTDVETLAAVSVLMRRTAFVQVGGFDEGYFLYGEDLDLCRRLRIAGWRLVGLPVLWATHADGSTSNSNLSREISWWEGTLRYAALWWPTPQWIAALAAGAIRLLRLSVIAPSVVVGASREVLPLCTARFHGRVRRRTAQSLGSVDVEPTDPNPTPSGSPG